MKVIIDTKTRKGSIVDIDILEYNSPLMKMFATTKGFNSYPAEIDGKPDVVKCNLNMGVDRTDLTPEQVAAVRAERKAKRS